MEIINNTAHDINIIEGARFISDIRKYLGGHVVRTYSHDKILNAQVAIDYDKKVNEIQLLKRKVMNIDPIPDDNSYHIVSSQYLSAARDLGKDISRLLTVGPIVVNEQHQIIGTTGLINYQNDQN